MPEKPAPPEPPSPKEHYDESFHLANFIADNGMSVFLMVVVICLSVMIVYVASASKRMHADDNVALVRENPKRIYKVKWGGEARIVTMLSDSFDRCEWDSWVFHVDGQPEEFPSIWCDRAEEFFKLEQAHERAKAWQ